MTAADNVCCAPLNTDSGRVGQGGESCCAGEVRRVPSGPEAVRAQVRAYYAERATTGSSCCGPGCGCGTENEADRVGTAVGYTQDELRTAPEGANLGLGCGNPTAIDEIPRGATVVDLGSGAGIDCFLAAEKVGTEGFVIGVDMTPEMVERARRNAQRVGAVNVDFRLGMIEDLPVADESVDVVISNCVINLSPDKPRAFREAYRVLKPGGKMLVSDLVLTRDLPDFVRESAEAYAGCIGGASLKDEYLGYIRAAGFEQVTVAGLDSYFDAIGGENSLSWLPEEQRAEGAAILQEGSPVVSLKVLAQKPVPGAS